MNRDERNKRWARVLWILRQAERAEAGADQALPEFREAAHDRARAVFGRFEEEYFQHMNRLLREAKEKNNE